MLRIPKNMTEQDKEYIKQATVLDSLVSNVKSLMVSVSEITKRLGDTDSKLDLHIASFEAYKEADEKWKQTATPVIQMGQSVQGFGKVTLYILGFFAAVATAVFTAISFFKDH